MEYHKIDSESKLHNINSDHNCSCPICYQNYGKDNYPLVIPCGHTVCNICFKRLKNAESASEFNDNNDENEDNDDNNINNNENNQEENQSNTEEVNAENSNDNNDINNIQNHNNIENNNQNNNLPPSIIENTENSKLIQKFTIIFIFFICLI